MFFRRMPLGGSDFSENCGGGSPVVVIDTHGRRCDYCQANAWGTFGTNALGNFGAGNITNNGAILYKRSDTVTLIHNISGTGSLTQEGPGELDLTTSGSTFTGPGPVVVNSGGTLGGSLVAGSVNITSGGAIAPGSGVGTLSVGSLDLDAGSPAIFEFSATPANDQITVATSGGLTMDGGALILNSPVETASDRSPLLTR